MLENVSYHRDDVMIMMTLSSLERSLRLTLTSVFTESKLTHTRTCGRALARRRKDESPVVAVHCLVVDEAVHRYDGGFVFATTS